MNVYNQPKQENHGCFSIMVLHDNCDNFGYFFDHSNTKKIVVMTEDDDELIDFDCNYVVV